MFVSIYFILHVILDLVGSLNLRTQKTGHIKKGDPSLLHPYFVPFNQSTNLTNDCSQSFSGLVTPTVQWRVLVPREGGTMKLLKTENFSKDPKVMICLRKGHIIKKTFCTVTIVGKELIRIL